MGDEEKRGTFGLRAEQTAKYLHLKIQMNAAPFRLTIQLLLSSYPVNMTLKI